MLSGLVRALAALAILGGATAGLIGGSAPARAAAEFMVNAPSALEQSSPAVARLANGFVAVWRGVIPRPDGLPGFVGVVDGQLFAANGTKVGGEFRVNKKFFGAAYVNLGLPAVAVLADGTFVVVWASDADDDEGWGNIQGQRFSAAGEKIGKEFRINRQATGPQQYRGIAALADGGFVVVWASSPDGTSAISYDIYGQRFSADGERVGPQFRVNRNDDGEEGNPAVAGFPDIAGMPRAVAPGGFVVVWDFDDQNVGPSAIYGQLYAADGSKVGGRFTIDKTDWDLQKPRVAMLADGGFVVIWERNIDFVYNIRAQRYSADGVKVGGALWVRRTRSESQAHADVAALSDGGFVIVFSDSEGQDGRIIGRRYAADGTPVDGTFRINSSTYQSYRLHSSVAGLKNGKYVVAWTGQEEGDPLVEDFDVFGRVFKD